MIAQAAGAQPLVEQFDQVGGLTGAGWVLQNNSQPIGTAGWFQGTTVFPSQASSGYVAANYQSVGLLGTISNWLILPPRSLNNGDTLNFWTRTVSPAAYADRLQVRLSTSGASTGSTATSTGDFTTLLLDINPTYHVSGPTSYPTEWTQFTVTIADLPAPVTGRLAFRYFVESAGENGANSDYIGIDTVEFTPGGAAVGRCCIVATGACLVTTSLTCQGAGGVFAGAGTTCDGFSCPAPATGACCSGDGTCLVTTAAACAAAGGVYRGNSTICSAGTCPLSFSYAGTPVILIDGTGSSICGPAAVAEVVVPVSFPVGLAEAAFVLRHTWQGDVKVRLTKVGGPSVWLIDRPGVPDSAFGFSSADFGVAGTTYFRVRPGASTIYDTPDVAFPGIPSVAGSWMPAGTLASFAGVDSLGQWRLEAFDCAGGESGEIRRFSLLLTPQAGASPCYANCDGSTQAPVLGANDFLCFINQFAASDIRANCDGSTTEPSLTANDFACFLARFNEGCP